VPDSVWDGPAGYAVSDDEDASDYDSDDADVEAGYAEVDTIEADVSDMVEDARADASDEDEDDEDEDDGDEDDGAGYAARRKKRRRRKGQSLTLHTTSGKRMRARRTGPKVIEWTVVHRKISGKPVEQRKVTTSSTQTIGKNLSKIVDSFTAEEKLITRPRHFFKHRTAKSVLTSVNQTGSTVRVQVLNLYTGAIKELSHRASSPRKAARIAKRLRSTLSKAKAWKSVAHGDVVRTVLKKRSKKAKKKDRQMSGTHASRVRRRRGGAQGYAATGAGDDEGYATAQREGVRFAERVMKSAQNWSGALGVDVKGGGDITACSESANNPVARMLSLANAVDQRSKLRDEMKLIRIENMRANPKIVLGTKGKTKTLVTPNEDLDARVQLVTGLQLFSSACHMVADNYDLDLEAARERPAPINVDKEAKVAVKKIDMAMNSGLKHGSVEAAQLQANRMVRVILSELADRSSESAMCVLARKLRWICDVCSAIISQAYGQSLKTTMASVRPIVSQHCEKWGVNYNVDNLGDGLVAVFSETALVARPVLTMSAEDIDERRRTTSLVAAVATKLKTQVGDADVISGINRSVFNKAPSMSVVGLLLEQMCTVSANAANVIAMLVAGAKMGAAANTPVVKIGKFVAELEAVLRYMDKTGNYADVARAQESALTATGGRTAAGYAAADDDSDDDSQPSLDDGADLDGYAAMAPECPFDRDTLTAAIGAWNPGCPPLDRVSHVYGSSNGNPEEGRVEDYFALYGTNVLGRGAFVLLRASHGGSAPPVVIVDKCAEGDKRALDAYLDAVPDTQHIAYEPHAVVPGLTQ
jgi:hypothetical protein